MTKVLWQRLEAIRMATLEFKNISHSYEYSFGKVKDKEKAEWVINNLNVVWEDGTANALLGPSGGGKTTMLNIISGLLRPSEGQVLINGKDVTELSPQERKIAQVFQFPVAYDTMNVYNNLAFPLRNSGYAKNKIDSKVRKTSELLNLDEYLYEPAGSLNEGEKQKVSLGRGIIRDDIVAMLLDEPLTLIDPKLKNDLRRVLMRIQRELKLTMVYVTHDQHEALTFADYVSILNAGTIVQSGTATELYDNPKQPFVGFFIGSPGMNFIDCSLSKGILDCKGFTLDIKTVVEEKGVKEEGEVKLGIRPESLIISKEEMQSSIPFNIQVVENFGHYRIITVEGMKKRIKAKISGSVDVSIGEKIYLSFPKDKIILFKQDARIL
jgi:glycerol transport system ATP-binding protein